ncbi:hypothetical protein [Paludibaculum fermentans]|uniref:Uncharacterized protein n=1 Tax=Paludibaculum fermentans TaxID=1473598 RepID=A0A7S7SLU3_PALFE|nr:hypothetical protein [Paludibaculum fermentans]QOY89709.1 hypothetical protein IRI77_07080 [Paludibaculum fermentans]
MRVVLTLIFLAALAWADTFKLYLKEGGYHSVTEYKVLEDRVRYYSAERGDWEEIPLDLVDLKKTEGERKSRVEAEKKDAAIEDAEEKFDRALKREISRIPVDSGVYFVENDKVVEVKTAEMKMRGDKKRSILKAMSPLPIISNKAVLELPGENSAVSVPELVPNFYFRIANVQRFSIVRLKPGKGTREVAVWIRQPVTNLVSFEMDLVEVFRQQLSDDLYKVWPTKPLTPGEYAMVQYAEGEGEIQIWDFRVLAKN